MSKKDKKDSDEKSGGKGKDKTAPAAKADALPDGTASTNGSLPADAGATSLPPAPSASLGTSGPGARTVVRPAPQTVGETVATASVDADTGSSAPTTVGSTTPVDALTGPTGSTPGSSTPVSVDTTTPIEALTEPIGGTTPPLPPSSPLPTPLPVPTSTALARRTPPAPGPRELSTDDVAEALLVPLRIARRVLPERRTPVVLGVAALALVGVVDLPVAVGIGLGWEVLRRWTPPEPPAARD